MPEIVELGSEGNPGESSSKKILLGKYEIGRFLGSGASGKVYQATNIKTGQKVAIKEINKQKTLFRKKDMMPDIMREISIMSQLNHPCIIKLFEVLATITTIYLVMEFAKGGTLYDMIRRLQKFSEDLSRWYFQQLISTVRYIHSQGVFHRDLKPENLLLDGKGHLKVTDFGLSADKSQVQKDGMLHSFCGSPAYIAPEIISRRAYNGTKSDIWSCGVILFACNTGFLPFNHDDRSELFRKILRGKYQCPEGMSSELSRFISRLLDLNPITRISIDEIIRDPWFKKGYKAIESGESSGFKEKEDQNPLNAFSIIALSPGLDLTGLFREIFSENEQFISAESPKRIMEMIMEVGTKHNLEVQCKESKLIIQGQNGKLMVGVAIYQLTESLVMVEVHSYDPIWKNKFKPELTHLVYQPKSYNLDRAGLLTYIIRLDFFPELCDINTFDERVWACLHVIHLL